MIAVKKAKGPDRWLWPNARKQVLGECPFGQPGDRLWLRETWAEYIDHDTSPEGALIELGRDIVYRADGEDQKRHTKWRSGVQMRREACRLALEITDVRVERLQAISEADAEAEGAMAWASEQDTPIRDLPGGDERIAFKGMWESTCLDWDSNPWVWVLEFKRVEVAGG